MVPLLSSLWEKGLRPRPEASLDSESAERGWRRPRCDAVPCTISLGGGLTPLLLRLLLLRLLAARMCWGFSGDCQCRGDPWRLVQPGALWCLSNGVACKKA